MTVLITGATGLVGSRITAQCRERNWTVHYLTTSKEKIVSEPGYKGFYWDPSKGDMDMACFEGVNAIINLAGANIAQRWTSSNKELILNSRLDSLRTLAAGLGQLGDHQILSLVSASAIGVYPSSYTNYYTESDEAKDDGFLGTVVEAWENQADAFKDLGLKVAKLRIGLVLSQDDGFLPKITKPVRYYAGAAMGSGQQWQSWIHIDDLARMFLFLVENEEEGIFNGVAPNPVTNAKLTREVAAVLEKPLFLPNIPKTLLHLALGDMAQIIFASQRVSSRKIEGEGFSFQFCNLHPALVDLLQENEDSQKPIGASSQGTSA